MSAQPWEYKLVQRSRALAEGSAQDWDIDIAAQLPALGDEGWELVAISAHSSQGHAAHAGVTSDEVWVFKRPRTILTSETMVVVAQAEAELPQSELTDARASETAVPGV
jgi:hypothetical protein